MKNVKKWTKWIYWFTLGVAIIFVYQTVYDFDSIAVSFWRLMSVLRPFLIAILVAYLFYIPCRNIEKLYAKATRLKRFARPLSVLTAYLIAILLVVMTINVVLPAVSRSVIDLASNLPDYYRQAIEFIEDIPEDSIIPRDDLLDVVHTLQEMDITTFINPENIANYISGAIRISECIV